MWVVLLLLVLDLSFAINLEEALKLAKENNKEIKSQRSLVDKARYDLSADRNLYLPEFYVNYRYSYQTQTQKMNLPLGFGTFSSSQKDYQNFSVGARLNLFDGGARSAKVDISKKQMDIELGLLKEKQEDVLLDVIEAYLDVLGAKALVEVYRRQEEAVRFTKDRAKAFYEQGLVAITDVLQAQVKLSEVQRELINAQGSYSVALSRLSQLVGVQVDKVEPVEVDPQIQTLEFYTKQALSNRDILKVYRYRVQQLKNLQEIDRSNFLPKVFLQGEYVYTDQNPTVKPKGFGIISIGFTLNFHGLEGYYRKLSHTEEEKKLTTDLMDLQDKIKLNIEKTYQDLLTSKEELKVAQDALNFAQQFYKLVQEQYENQIVGMLELLDAQASLTRAQKNRELAYYQYLKNYYRLLREGGMLK